MKVRIRIFQNDCGNYTAVCPTLPGCTCRGQSVEEARDRLDEAIRGYLAAMSNFVPEHLDQEVLEVH